MALVLFVNNIRRSINYVCVFSNQKKMYLLPNSEDFSGKKLLNHFHSRRRPSKHMTINNIIDFHPEIYKQPSEIRVMNLMADLMYLTEDNFFTKADADYLVEEIINTTSDFFEID